jgi:chromosome segregation ATPase
VVTTSPLRAEQVPELAKLQDIGNLQNQTATFDTILPLHASQISELAKLETSLDNIREEVQKHKTTSIEISTLSKGITEIRQQNEELELGSQIMSESWDRVIPLIFEELREVKNGLNSLADELEEAEEEIDIEDKGKDEELEAGDEELAQSIEHEDDSLLSVGSEELELKVENDSEISLD